MSRHVRSNSASLDNKAFREAVSRMRVEVLESKAETQQVKDQLNCLVMLVKRAWMGDQAAAIHVSNIVGVAPPKFEEEKTSHELTAVYKSSSIHHWAMLSIGLLNRHYKQLEQQALTRAKSRLQRRQDYLDEQLSTHRDVLRKAAGNRLDTSHKTKLYLDKESDSLKHLKNKKSHPKSSPIQRPFYGSACTNGKYNILAADSHNTRAANNLVQYLAGTTLNDPLQMTSQHNRRGNEGKYTQPGLFDTSNVVSDRPKKICPTRGDLLKSDAQRARPKSAVVIKGERPLKYETTRPVSAKMYSSTKPSMVNIKPSRAKSAKATTHHAPIVSLNVPSLLPDNGGLSQGQRQNAMTFSTKKQDSVEAFSQDMRRMQSMEDNFKRTAKMLQQKIGIPGEGTV